MITATAGEHRTHHLSLAEPGSLPAEVMMEWLASWAWFPGLALTLTFLGQAPLDLGLGLSL